MSAERRLLHLPPSNDSPWRELIIVGIVGFIIVVSYEMRRASELDSKISQSMKPSFATPS